MGKDLKTKKVVWAELIKAINKLLCKHDYKFIRIEEERMLNWRVYKCKKCNKIINKYGLD